MEKDHPAFKYASDVTSRRIPAPKYVKLQCRAFKAIAAGKDKRYFIDDEQVERIGELLRLLFMPKGLKRGQTIYESLCGFQWLLIIAVLCVVHRENPARRRYETAILEIGRKNGKTFLMAIIFLLLLLIEPPLSLFYSVAPDGKISREVQTDIRNLIAASSPILRSRFKIRRDDILCLETSSQYFPLNYSTSRLDGRLPNAYIADEIGALPNGYAVDAMRGGQLTILNKLGLIISTKYETTSNPFEDELDAAKKILDGTYLDDTVFALLYEPDDVKNWMKNDRILQHANPLALDFPEVMADLLGKRRAAIFQPHRREYFLTKHANIVYQGNAETFVQPNELQRCRSVGPIDWSGRRVWIGVDLSLTTDNCAAVMLAEDDGKVLVRAMSFIPEGRMEDKAESERVDYGAMCESGFCTACGDSVVDYGVIEDYVLGLEARYGVEIVSIGFDRYNAVSSAQKWEREGYTTVIVRQHSDTLCAPVKLLKELILSGKLIYDENPLLDINFSNVRVTYDTNLNQYINKKKSRGKIDVVAALVNALYLLQQDVLLSNDNSWAVLL